MPEQSYLLNKYCFVFLLVPGVAEFAASFKSPITSSPPKWMAEIERDDIDMLKELGSLTTANLMEKVRGLQNLAYQLGLDECEYSNRICSGLHAVYYHRELQL
uniref:Protein lin-52 homolog n=1 Tax=Mandrillus leucophaeus TaxID=9568 RepID=A0A2K5YJE4_MANLE